MKQLIKYIKETIIKEKYILKFILVLLFIGIIAGSLFINFLTKADKSLLINQLEAFLEGVKSLSGEVFGINAFASNLSSNLFQIVFIFILGLSIIGIPVVIFIMFYKGFILGVTLGSFILKYELKGSIGIILYTVPSQILILLIYLFISFFACFVSIRFLKAFIKKDNLNFKNFIGKYSLAFIITIILIIISSLFDAFILPLLMKLFTFII